ncbi:MAG: hypothetical protein ACK421_12315, partial [Pseudanabaenaceae cyanobacterium]
MVSLLFYVVRQGLSRFDLAAFTQLPPPPHSEGGGFANALVGTIVMVTMAMVWSVPLGVAAAVYVAEFDSDPDQGGRLAGQEGAMGAVNLLGQGIGGRGIKVAANVLYSVPSILTGVFVYGLIVLPT